MSLKIKNDLGSRLLADPKLQLPNKKAIKDITSDVKNVVTIQEKTNDWKSKAVDTAILAAAAAALVAIGVIVGVATPVGTAAITVGAFVFAYAGYSAVQTAGKAASKDDIEDIHSDAIQLRFSEKIQDQQNKADSEKKKADKAAAQEKQMAEMQAKIALLTNANAVPNKQKQ